MTLSAAAAFRSLLLLTALAAFSASYGYADMMAFVTIYSVNGTSSDISTYNNLVSNELSTLSLDIPAGYTLNSCAMVSTSTVNLVDNCANVIDGGEVFNYFDDDELADSFTDFLSGPFQSDITQSDGGEGRAFWTGSTDEGIASADPLGASEATVGVALEGVDDPLDFEVNYATSENSVLGLFSITPDAAPAPEPSTGGMAAIGVIGIVLILLARTRAHSNPEPRL